MASPIRAVREWSATWSGRGVAADAPPQAPQLPAAHENPTTPGFFRFYARVLRKAPRAVWDALGSFGNVVLIVLGVLFLLNRKLAEAVSSWHGISAWWAIVPFGVLVGVGLLRANYELFRASSGTKSIEQHTHHPPLAEGQEEEMEYNAAGAVAKRRVKRAEEG